ncbi:hypothetical protein H8A97_30535 [Bradyrhizobium sp. Arg62]|uniref:hypothetical protein n=1 Tax=Bradyrhizobium brasilense TaxID=1419277 RepID=UPI001E47D949|nr:hypothetical protein [Bradyrhizobium brasilense]MCC8949324.1 hypothetical protein [Bradyrhizobium brasilense]
MIFLLPEGWFVDCDGALVIPDSDVSPLRGSSKITAAFDRVVTTSGQVLKSSDSAEILRAGRAS